jgi:MFS family permease
VGPERLLPTVINREFAKLWLAESVSALGSQVTRLALPLVAALVLGASPGQMGLLVAAEFAPSAALGLFAGVWIDRLRRRPIMIAADLASALLLATIPLAALLGVLRIEQLYAVALLAGTCRLFGDVARSSFLPGLVPRERLVDANGKIAMSESVASVAGPGLGGALVQLLTAPVAIALDALSFLLSALCLSLVRADEKPAPPTGRTAWSEIGDGLRFVFGHPALRAQVGATALLNLFAGAITAAEMLFYTRELGLDAALLGAVFAAGGAASILGAALAGRAATRFGLGPTLIGAIWVFSLAHFPIALAGGPRAAVVALFVIGLAGIRLVYPIYGVTFATLLQGVTPEGMLGRVSASVRFLLLAPPLVGALAGGLLGEEVGLRGTLVLGAVGNLAACLWLTLSPVRRVRTL